MATHRALPPSAISACFRMPARALRAIFRAPASRARVAAGCVLSAAGLLAAAPLSARADDALALGQSKLGNVFLAGETVEIPVQTTGDALEWTVSDFFGGVSTGRDTVPAAGGNRRVMIRPAAPGRLGYFELHVTARRAHGVLATADTTFAVLAPVDLSKLADSPFGVMTHFAQGWNTDLMPLIARAGLRHIRDEQYWEEIERERGHYVFNESYRAYMAAAAANGLDLLTPLTFDNKLYDHDPADPTKAWAPCTDDGRAGYANYAAAVLARYPSQIGAVEVWNEYNGGWCNGPASRDRPVFYTRMLQAAYPALKARRPDVRVLGGAAIMAPLPWFEDLFKAGALDSLDGLAIHPYVGIPEDAEKAVSALRELMSRYSHGAGPKPIWATECGAPDQDHHGRQDMARYLVRLLTVLRAAGVERIHWYLMRDYNDFVTGLLHSDRDPLGRYVPTSAYAAYAALVQQLSHARFVRRETTDLRTRAYLFEKAGGELRVVWSTDSPAHLVLTTGTPLMVIDIMGNASVRQPQGGAVALTADRTPLYVLGPVEGIRETGRDVLLADSVADFSGTQGTGPGTWTYGYYFQGEPRTYRSSDFKPLTWTRTPWDYRWACEYPYAIIGAADASPGNGGGRQTWTIRRWQSNAEGAARITGMVNRGSAEGDGTGVKVLVDGEEKFSQLIPPAGKAGFDLHVDLRRGSLVDFVTTPGPAADINFDTIEYRARITQPAATEPAGSPKR